MRSTAVPSRATKRASTTPGRSAALEALETALAERERPSSSSSMARRYSSRISKLDFTMKSVPSRMEKEGDAWAPARLQMAKLDLVAWRERMLGPR